MSSPAVPAKSADASVGVVPYEGGEIKEDQKLATPRTAQSRKAQLSAYMTIAAAAFGLISDGCTSNLRVFAESEH